MPPELQSCKTDVDTSTVSRERPSSGQHLTASKLQLVEYKEQEKGEAANEEGELLHMLPIPEA